MFNYIYKIYYFSQCSLEYQMVHHYVFHFLIVLHVRFCKIDKISTLQWLIQPDILKAALLIIYDYQTVIVI